MGSSPRRHKTANKQASKQKPRRGWGGTNSFVLSYKLTSQFNFLSTKHAFFLLQIFTPQPCVLGAAVSQQDRENLPAQRATCNRILVIETAVCRVSREELVPPDMPALITCWARGKACVPPGNVPPHNNVKNLVTSPDF